MIKQKVAYLKINHSKATEFLQKLLCSSSSRLENLENKTEHKIVHIKLKIRKNADPNKTEIERM